MNEKDVLLYQRIQKGDQSALEELYDRYEKLLFSFIYKLTNSRELTEEAIQEVFLKIWTKKGLYDSGKGKFSSWILTVSRHMAIDLMRKKKVTSYTLEDRDSLQSQEPTLFEKIEWKENAVEINDAVNQLNDEQRTVIVLFYFKAFTQRKIADHLGIPLGTVKGRIRLALQHLKKNMVASDKGGEYFE